MTNKNLAVLAVAAVALGGAALYLNSSSRPAGAKLNGEKVLPGLDAAEVASIEFGEKLRLSAGDDGWKIDTYYGYPADRTKIADNLMKLVELKVGQVARGKKIEKPESLVLRDAAGKALAELPLGERHAKWGHGRYALYKGEAVLLSDQLDAFESTDADADAKRWCETKIVDEPWISFNKVADPKADAAAYGFATGVVAKVTIGGDTNRTITVGAPVKGGSDRYVKLDGSDWVYEVSSYSVEKFLPKPEEPKTEAKTEEKAAEPEAEAKAEEPAKVEAPIKVEEPAKAEAPAKE